MKKKAADWAVLSFLKAAQIWSTRPMRYSPVQADQKEPNWAATRPIWQHWHQYGGRVDVSQQRLKAANEASRYLYVYDWTGLKIRL